VRLDGRDVFINRLGRWEDPVAVARAQAISAQIWSDYKEGTFDRSLLRYTPLVKGQQVGLLEAMQTLADSTHNARCCIHVLEAAMLLEVQKVNRAYKDLEGLVLGQIRQGSKGQGASLMGCRISSGCSCFKSMLKIKSDSDSNQADVGCCQSCIVINHSKDATCAITILSSVLIPVDAGIP